MVEFELIEQLEVPTNTHIYKSSILILSISKLIRILLTMNSENFLFDCQRTVKDFYFVFRPSPGPKISAKLLKYSSARYHSELSSSRDKLLFDKSIKTDSLFS